MESTQRAREYSRLKDRLALIGTALDLLVGAIFLFSGLTARFNRQLLPRGGGSLRNRFGYVAAMSLISWVASLPLSFYGGYIIEKRYELSNETPSSWLRDRIKGKAISLPIELGVVTGMYAAIRRWPQRWWLVVSAAIVPLTAVFAQLFPVLIAPRFNKYEPLKDQQLAERLKDLTDRAGVPVADVMQMDMSRRTTKANAFFAGIGRTKRIVLGDTMIEQFTPQEIEGVIAHETAHQVHRDIWRFVGLSGLFTMVTARFVDAVARRLLVAFPQLTGTRHLSDIRSLPVIGFTLTVIGLSLTPFQLAYSRHIERKADRYAINLTRDPAAYASAMEKLSLTNLADPNPPRIITMLLHSHPPLAERVAHARVAEYNMNVGLTGD